MKKISKFLLMFSIVFGFLSCEKDESKNPLPILEAGQFVRFDITSRILNFDDMENTYFGGTITTPGNNVKMYTLKIKRRNSSVFSGDYVEILKVTKFPYEVKITPQDIATSLNIEVSDLKSNDFYFFYAEAQGFDGNITTYNNLSFDVRNNNSMKQGYRFLTQFFLGGNYITSLNTYNNYDFSL